MTTQKSTLVDELVAKVSASAGRFGFGHPCDKCGKPTRYYDARDRRTYACPSCGASGLSGH